MPDMLVIAAAAAAVGALVGVGVVRWRIRSMLGLEHVHTFVDRVDSLRAAALDRFDTPVRPAGDPRVGETSAGLALVYTIGADGDDYRHHLTLRRTRGKPERAVLGRFLLLAMRRLRVDGAQVELGVSPAGVYHARWVLDAEAQALFVDRAPAALDDRALGALFDACLDEAGRAPFEALDAELAEAERAA